jgi:hypothetical protein
MPLLTRNAIVVFHDYETPAVAEAIADLGLRGLEHHGLYVWRREWADDFGGNAQHASDEVIAQLAG